DLEGRHDLPAPARLEPQREAEGERGDERDGDVDVAGQEHEQLPELELARADEADEGREHERLVRDGVQQLAQPGPRAGAASEPAIDAVADPGDERDPAPHGDGIGQDEQRCQREPEQRDGVRPGKQARSALGVRPFHTLTPVALPWPLTPLPRPSRARVPPAARPGTPPTYDSARTPVAPAASPGPPPAPRGASRRSRGRNRRR